MKKTLSTLALGALIALAGCGQEAAQTEPTQPQASSAASSAEAKLPEGLFLKEAPTGAKKLHEVRAAAKAGDAVTFTGYAGGRANPFTDQRAIFLVADAEKTPPCTDGCKTAWDACCSAPEVIAANSATVQVADASGQILKTGLRGKAGLAPGSAVTISGKVREANSSMLLVDASGIWVAPKKP